MSAADKASAANANLLLLERNILFLTFLVCDPTLDGGACVRRQMWSCARHLLPNAEGVAQNTHPFSARHRVPVRRAAEKPHPALIYQ